MNIKPGRVVASLGTFVAVVGFLFLMAYTNEAGPPVGFFFCSVLVIAGLLLRIEGAVVGAGSRNAAGANAGGVADADPSADRPVSRQAQPGREPRGLDAGDRPGE